MAARLARLHAVSSRRRCGAGRAQHSRSSPLRLACLPLLPATDPAHLAPLSDPAAFLDIWTPLSRGADPPLEQVLAALCLCGMGHATALSWLWPPLLLLLLLHECCRPAGPAAAAAAAVAHTRTPARTSGANPLPPGLPCRPPLPPAPSLQMLPGDSDASPAELARVEKFMKGRLAAAAEHFNRDSKKGFQFLQVTLIGRAGLVSPVLWEGGWRLGSAAMEPKGLSVRAGGQFKIALWVSCGF